MHKNHLKHSNFENCWFRYVIYLSNHKKNRPKTETSPKKLPLKMFGSRAFYQKNHFLANFCARTGKKYRGGLRSILMPLTLHIAHLNCHCCNISGVPLRLTWCQGFGARACQSQVTQIRAHRNRRFWGVFCTNLISWPNGHFLPVAFHTYSERYGSGG